MEHSPEEVYGDPALPLIHQEATHTERTFVQILWFEAKDVVLGGFNGLRQHPVGSVEAGSALALSGFAAAGVLVLHSR